MKDWKRQEPSITRAETAYIDMHRWELVSIGDRTHLTYTRLERGIEVLVYWLTFLRHKVSSSTTANFHELIRTQLHFCKAKRDEPTLLIHRPFVRECARVIVALLAIILLLVPILGLNAAEKSSTKFVIIFVAASVFVSSVTILSAASIGEVFAAGAAYAAVMVVFVSGNGVQAGP